MVNEWAKLDNLTEIETDQVAYFQTILPNNAVTWTKNSNMRYIMDSPFHGSHKSVNFGWRWLMYPGRGHKTSSIGHQHPPNKEANGNGAGPR